MWVALLFLFDDPHILWLNVGAQCTKHLEVDEEHTFGTAFGFQESAFITVKQTTDDAHSVTLVQFYLFRMEIGDVILHLCGRFDESFHLAGGHLQDFILTLHLLIGVSDERVRVADGVQLAEWSKGKQRVGNQGAFHDGLFPVDGHIVLYHRAERAHPCCF